MKTLYVLRHAKSSWDKADLADFDRPLNERGRSTAPFMGELMKREGFIPEMVLSSPAARARQTAELASRAAGVATEIKFKEKIYEASPQTLLQIVQSLDDRLNSVMVVGHNPGMEGFVRLLTARIEAMSTAALAVIDLDIAGWEQVAAGTGRLRKLIRPKDEMKTMGKRTGL